MSGSIALALTAAAARLAEVGVAEPMRDVRALMSAALGMAPDRLLLVAQDPLPTAARANFEQFVAARLRRQPVAQIIGRRIFWGRTFEVTGEVLDPRPETETLVACALDGPPAGSVLDLGTGSGVILVTLLLEWPGARGVGTDISSKALSVAARNAATHRVTGRAELHLADWTQGLHGRRFDLVACNPPYIPAAEIAHLAPDVREWEPLAALSPGPSGLESYRRIAELLESVLAPEGRALFEFGVGQGNAVASMFRKAGFPDLTLHQDLDGRDRVLSVRRAV